MQRLFHFGGAAIRWGSVLAMLAFLGTASGASLQDFGYQSMNVNGKLAIGQRPLLLIVANFAGETDSAGNPEPMVHDAAYYDDLVFNLSRYPSVNGYFKAVSNGRFSWTRAGVVQLNLPASAHDATWPGPPHVHDAPYTSNLVYQAMASGQFNFKAFDANGDGHITQDELGILVVGNDFTGCRFAGGAVASPDGSYDWGQGSSYVALDRDTDSAFVVMCEEFEETLGCVDLYGDLDYDTTLTPQGAPICGTDCFYIYYLDPWQRMCLGWSQPRILPLPAGGVVTLSAVQAGDPAAPVILYDPAHGTGEFWMLEYRTPTSPNGGGYDANVAGYASTDTNGLAVWHIQQSSGHTLMTTVSNNITLGRQPADWNEGPPNLKWGASTLWGSDSVTPVLTWQNNDPTAATPAPTRTHLHVRPFAAGDGSITVEVLTDGDVWVDFGWKGAQNGTEANPFDSLAQGLSALPYGDASHIFIKAGKSPAPIAINQPAILEAVGGTVVIGR